MEPAPPRSLADSIAAAHDWWREAGVDLAFHDEPRAWLAEEQPAAEAPSERPASPLAPERVMAGGDRAGWPNSLADFAGWWREAPGLGPASGRIAPRGPTAASLMIVVPMPEADDRDTLLSGREGRLISNMVRAMGIAPGTVYVASVFPRHILQPDWQTAAEGGLGEILRHHVQLAAPQRVLVLGRDVLPLLGHDPAQAAPPVSELAIQSGKLPLLSSYAPGRLLDHPRLRAELWRRWLEWTGTEQ